MHDYDSKINIQIESNFGTILSSLYVTFVHGSHTQIPVCRLLLVLPAPFFLFDSTTAKTLDTWKIDRKKYLKKKRTMMVSFHDSSKRNRKPKQLARYYCMHA